MVKVFFGMNCAKSMVTPKEGVTEKESIRFASNLVAVGRMDQPMSNRAVQVSPISNSPHVEAGRASNLRITWKQITNVRYDAQVNPSSHRNLRFAPPPNAPSPRATIPFRRSIQASGALVGVRSSDGPII